MTEVQEALRAVDGVAEATVEESHGTPVGVRVELESGADERSVASGVQTVLSSFGLRSRLAPPRTKLEPVIPPPPPTVLPIRPDPRVDGPEGPGEVRAEEPPEEAVPVGANERMTQVTLAQRDDGVGIVVSGVADRSIELLSRPGAEAVAQAIVRAVAELVDPEQPSPGLVSVDYQEYPGAELVTVVLEVGVGVFAAAAELVTGGRELALARATWKALSGN